VHYGTTDTSGQHTNDFDLHFLNPSLPHGTPDTDAVKSLPTATAIRNQAEGGVKKLGKIGETVPLMSFLAGARIVGVEFPEDGEGKWCLGWHDGVFGVFPSKNVHLDMPRRGEMTLQGNGNTGRGAITRWKWDKKMVGSSFWLTFDKGEQIVNIDCEFIVMFRSSI
jgi:hypothetical protein